MPTLVFLLACTFSDAPSPPPPPAAPEAPKKAKTGKRPRAPEGCSVKVFVGLERGPTPFFDAPDGERTGVFPKLPPPVPGSSAGPILHVVDRAHHGEWLKVDEVVDYTLEDKSKPRGPTEGWVRRDHLAVDLAMSEVSPALMPPPPIRLWSDASPDSAVLRVYLQEAHRAEVLDCRGEWIQVRVHLLGVDEAPMEGWLAPGDHCGHPFTTCG